MSVERLAELVRERQPCVVLTGAGISTESGIPDFRSAEGIWATYDPFEVAHVDALRRDPVRVWEFYALRLGLLGRAEPNDGHLALVELEERGLVRAVVTQNVDGLHQRAGSREVVEVHGSLREAECVHCGVRVAMADALEQLPLPACPECGEVLKPGVVMFGELLPAEAIERAQSHCVLECLDRFIRLGRGHIPARHPCMGGIRIEHQRPVDGSCRHGAFPGKRKQGKPGHPQRVRVVLPRLQRLPREGHSLGAMRLGNRGSAV